MDGVNSWRLSTKFKLEANTIPRSNRKSFLVTSAFDNICHSSFIRQLRGYRSLRHQRVTFFLFAAGFIASFPPFRHYTDLTSKASSNDCQARNDVVALWVPTFVRHYVEVMPPPKVIQLGITSNSNNKKKTLSSAYLFNFIYVSQWINVSLACPRKMGAEFMSVLISQPFIAWPFLLSGVTKVEPKIDEFEINPFSLTC